MSLDRAVSVGGFPTFQMGAGSLTKPEQFVVVDDNTVRVDFAKKDRLTIPDLAVIVPCIINVREEREGFCRSRLRRHATHSAVPAYVNVAMQKNVSGYQYWFHRRLDYRALVKG